MFDPETGFGNSSDAQTGCVTSGPFQEGQFEVSLNGSDSCLTREYNNYVFFDRARVESSLSLGADMYEEFHNFVQLLLTLNVRCFVGGALCTPDTASDPLFLLHLARIDLLVQRWQEADEANTVVQRSNKADPLALTLDTQLTVADFCSNEELAYGTCVRYALLDPVEDMGGDASTVHCASEEVLEGAGVSLTEEARLYLSRTCTTTP